MAKNCRRLLWTAPKFQQRHIQVRRRKLFFFVELNFYFGWKQEMMLRTKPNSNQQLTAKTFLYNCITIQDLNWKLNVSWLNLKFYKTKLDNFSCFTYELCYVWTAPLTLVSYEPTIYKLASRAMAQDLLNNASTSTFFHDSHRVSSARANSLCVCYIIMG